MTALWPPPAAQSTEWVKTFLSSGVRVDLRRAQLWGSEVLIDADGEVFCDGCAELLSPSDLLLPGNGHRPAPARLASVGGIETWSA